MNNELKPYISLPNFFNLKQDRLEYRDVLVYTALRSFNNENDSLCNPMHKNVGKRASACKNYVIASIKRLEASGAIRVDRSNFKNTSNQYYFAKPWYNSAITKVPKDYFEKTTELSSCESAMLLCIRPSFNEFGFELHDKKPVNVMAKWLGLTVDQVRKQFASLKSKGFVSEHMVTYKKKDYTRTYYKLTDKVNWDFSEYEMKEEHELKFTLRVGTAQAA